MSCMHSLRHLVRVLAWYVLGQELDGDVHSQIYLPGILTGEGDICWSWYPLIREFPS